MGKGGEKLREFPDRQLVIRGNHVKVRKPHTRPIKDVDKPPIRTNLLNKVDRSLVNLHRFNKYLRQRARTETSSWQTGTETSTTRKDDSSPSKATEGASSTSSTRTSKRRLLKTLLSDLK
jgi:hypothetical protein